MLRKITAILLSVLLVVALTTAAAFAADPQEKNPVIYFDANEIVWKDSSQIYCHIWEYNGDSFFEWQMNKEKCSDVDNNGIWTYDLGEAGIALEDGKLYGVMFSTAEGEESYPLFMDSSCYEDTAYVSEETVENPAGSQYTDESMVYWTKSDPDVYGPVLMITPTGNVTGEICPPGRTPSDLLKSVLSSTVWLNNVRTGTGMSDQEIVDHLKEGLSLTDDEVLVVIMQLDDPVDWTPSSPATPDQPTIPPTEPEPTLPPSTGILGDVDCDGVVTVIDATLIQKYKAHLIDETKIDMSVADVDGDGSVTIMDACRIQRYKAGLCDLDGYTKRSETALYFDPATVGWNGSQRIGFHIVSAAGEDLTEFGSEAERAEKNPDGTFRMDKEDINVELDGDEQYLIVFYNDDGDTTYELVFDKSCFGDVARCSGEIFEKPAALWKDQDKKVCGPRLAIGPTGNVVGDCIPKGETPYTVLNDFFKEQYTDAVSRSGKTSQAMVDDIAQQIGIRYQYEISVAIVESGTNVNWAPTKCPLPVRG